ncbi:LacI family DNA-binding transcriptional regulator [Shewanella sp. SNU WT4]|uniref:LacI family DNA-binding transcriptional regulator n=1 Tax=Shewanella sp. SNU WT4 TaxID=2590015 RepID=UPI001F102BC7|nr:LacI family DNA-binding transcriptional regulator [Shewanella sp. SNU WT4]
MVTSRDVAKLAGVSQSTVSRVFVEGSSCSEKTKTKVMQAAKALNYRPNSFARSLTTQESRLIGLVFPDAEYPLHMKTLQLLSSTLQARGYSAVLIPWQYDDHNQHSIPNIFNYRVDGVIAASAQFNNHLYEECQQFSIPIVQFARVAHNSNSSFAISDNYNAGKMAAEKLKTAGVKRPAYLTGNIPTLTNSERWRGFNDTVLQLYGHAAGLLETNYDYEQALPLISQMLDQANRPDGIFCSTDLLAIALIDSARHQHQLRIPDDLQVLGFDDIPQAAWLNYQLTTFKQDFERLALESINILLAQLSQQTSHQTQLMIPVQLIERSTTR